METGTEAVTEVSKEQSDAFFESGGEKVPEAVVEQKSEPELEVKPEPVVEEKKPDDRHVPLAALHEERLKRKDLQSKVERMEQTFQQLVQSVQQPSAPAPTFDDDPIQNLKNENDAIKQHLQQQIEQNNVAQNRQNLVNTYRSHAAEFTKTTPDFNDAYSFISQQRQAEYEAAGYSPQDAASMLIQDEMAIVYKALQDEVNPAERVYNLAKVRGYKGKSVVETTKMEIAEKGIKAGKSLSSASGVADGEVTLESLAELPTDEFNKAWKKMISDKS